MGVLDAACGICFPVQRLNPGPLHCQCRVLATGKFPGILPSMSFKLLVLPAISIGISLLFGFTSVERFVSFEMFATPVATASFSMAQNMGGDGELAGQLVVLSTAVSVITIFLWVFGLSSVGMV